MGAKGSVATRTNESKSESNYNSNDDCVGDVDGDNEY